MLSCTLVARTRIFEYVLCTLSNCINSVTYRMHQTEQAPPRLLEPLLEETVSSTFLRQVTAALHKYVAYSSSCT